VDAPLGSVAAETVGLVAPQPSRGGAQRLTLPLARPSTLRVSVYDVTGRRVRTPFDVPFTRKADRLR